MNSDSVPGAEPEWDAMMEAVMDSIPVKLSYMEWRDLRSQIHKTVWTYLSDIFNRASVEFRDRSDGPEVRLWMGVGQDSEDLQRGFLLSEVLEEACSPRELLAARDMLSARIAQLEQGDAP